MIAVITVVFSFTCTYMKFRFSFLKFATLTEVSGHGFDQPIRQHSFVETGHAIISTAILVLQLIQVGRLPAAGIKTIVHKHNVP